jgi:hypothetical protein
MKKKKSRLIPTTPGTFTLKLTYEKKLIQILITISFNKSKIDIQRVFDDESGYFRFNSNMKK